MTVMKTRGMRRQVIGTVVSDKMDKTIVVQVDRQVKHPLFHKYISRRTKYAAHDADNSCRTGDKVLIAESRPLSKTKSWRVLKVVEKAI